jgi:aspartate/glutamate racemase
MIKVHIIAPDLNSGNYFNNTLIKNGIETDFKVYKISPRVIKNKLSTSSSVVDDLNQIFRNIENKFDKVVIACNTLQLWLPKIDQVYLKKIKVFTTFDACDWKFNNLKNKPIWLGTTPLVETIDKYVTFLNLNDFSAQDLNQDLIWRIKMLGGDDVSTATENVSRDMQTSKNYQKIKINSIKEDLISSLSQHNIHNVILGCTELPIVFNKQIEKGIKFFDPADILARYIKTSKI